MTRITITLALATLAGCAASSSRLAELQERRGEEREMEMGPPPPGYWRIRGDAVPGWKPEDMHAIA